MHLKRLELFTTSKAGRTHETDFAHEISIFSLHLCYEWDTYHLLALITAMTVWPVEFNERQFIIILAAGSCYLSVQLLEEQVCFCFNLHKW